MPELPREELADAAKASAPDQLAVASLYGEVRRIARDLMRTERANHTLPPTAVANEAWLRLFGGQPPQFTDDAAFLAAAVSALRRVLVEHGRRRLRQKRGGGQAHTTLRPDEVAAPAGDERMLALDEALARLAAFDPGKSRLVELRFFGGLSVEEAAQVLGLSPRTAARDWRVARAFLRAQLRDGIDDLDD